MRTNDIAFTLIELILVMALIMILSVIGIGSYTQATVKARDTQRKNDLNQIAKALEVFNNDLNRYPKVDDVTGLMTCPQAILGTEGTCFGGIIAYFDGELTTYMDKIPEDPTSGRVYLYVPSEPDHEKYSYYAALDNLEDRDVVTDVDGNKTNWGEDCGGGVMCNYKITETGLVRTK